MSLVHGCDFCGLERPAESEVMMPPRCAGCSCLLVVRPAAAQVVARVEEAGAGARWLLLVLSLAMLAASLRVGYDAGGWSAATIAAGLCGMTLAPLAGASQRR